MDLSLIIGPMITLGGYRTNDNGNYVYGEHIHLNITGGNNTLIGINAGANLTSESDCTIIGNNVQIEPGKDGQIKVGRIDLVKLLERVDYLEQRVLELEYVPPGQGGPRYEEALTGWENHQ